VKVLVFGSREWVSPKPIRNVLKMLPKGSVVIAGACQGADNIAADEARKLKDLELVVREYPADWDTFGLDAGPIRNQQMLDEEHPDQDGVCIDQAYCFHRDAGLGKGSRDMADRLKKAVPEIPLDTMYRKRG